MANRRKKNRFGFNLNLGPLKVSIGKSWAELNHFFDVVVKGTAKKETAVSQIQEYRSWVQIATNVIYRRVSEVDYKFFRSDKDEEIKKGSPIYNVIHKIFTDPNPYMEFRFIKQYLQLQLDLTGMAFLLREDDAFKKPFQIWPLMSVNLDKINKGSTFKNWIESYTFNENGSYITYPASRIMYFHYPHPKDPRDPCSPIQAQAYAIDIDHYIEAYERDFFKNSARPDLAISYPEDVQIEEDDAERIVTGWKKKFQGEGRYHEVAVLDQGATLKEINPKNEDLALMMLASWSQEKVLAAYAVPPAKVGIVKDVNKANDIGVDITFNSECVLPRLRLMDEVLTRGILQRFDERLEIKHNNPVPRDQKADIEDAKVKVGVPTRTINEQREIDGQKSVPGGDVIMVPLNFVTFGAPSPKAEEPPPEKKPKEEEEEEKSVENKHVREYSDEWLTTRWYVFKAFTEAWERVWVGQLKILFEDQQEEVLENLEAYWNEARTAFTEGSEVAGRIKEKWEGLLKAYKDQSAVEIVGFLSKNPEALEKIIGDRNGELKNIIMQSLVKKESLEEIMGTISDYANTKAEEAIDYILFDYDKNKKAFDKTGKQITSSVLVESANEELTMLGLDASFGLENKLAREFLGKKVAEFSKEVLSTKATQLTKALAAGFEAGEDIRRLSERVQGVYGQVVTGGYEAIRIARTETIAASNAGSMMGYKSSGVVKEKGWLSVRDQRTRGADPGDMADHYHMDGQRVKLDDPFVDPVSGARMMFPGDTSKGAGGKDTILCRCTQVPYTDEKVKKGETQRKIAEEMVIKQYGLTSAQAAKYRKIMRLDSKGAGDILTNANLTKEQFYERLGETRLSVKALGITKEKYYNKKTGLWTKKRAELHDKLADNIVKGVSAHKRPTLLMTGGYPGSGKSTILDKAFPGWKKDYVHIDSDQIKASLALHGDKVEHLGWRAQTYHWEADDVIDLAMEKAIKRKKNILFDGTMKSKDKIVKMIEGFKKNGYEIEVAFADLPIEKSIERAIGRFLGKRGRFVDPAYIMTHGKQNLETLEAVKSKVNHWYHYSTDVARGEAPKLIGKK